MLFYCRSGFLTPFRIVSDGFDSFSNDFGWFRIVFGQFRIVCGRFRIVFAPFRTISNRKKPETRNGNENEQKQTEKTNKKAEINCENHFLLKPLKPKVMYIPEGWYHATINLADSAAVSMQRKDHTKHTLNLEFDARSTLNLGILCLSHFF